MNPDWPADTGVMIRRRPDSWAGFQVLVDHRKSGSIGRLLRRWHRRLPRFTAGHHGSRRDYWYRGHARRARSEPLHRRGQDHQSAGVRSNRQRSGLADRPVTGVLAGRGIGVLDMARSIRTGSRPLASGELAYHVLDTLMAIDEAIATSRTVEINSSVDAIPLVAEDWDPFAATLEA